MGFVDFIITALFVGFVAFLVIGFNRQMIAKNEKRDEKYGKIRDKNKILKKTRCRILR